LQKHPKIILGIDPGTLLMGYGIIEISRNVICMKEMSVLKLSGKKDNYIRLQLIHKKIEELIENTGQMSLRSKPLSLVKMFKVC
jgi:crossover junction endodeoxyribonuclease RuvC